MCVVCVSGFSLTVQLTEVVLGVVVTSPVLKRFFALVARDKRRERGSDERLVMQNKHRKTEQCFEDLHLQKCACIYHAEK